MRISEESRFPHPVLTAASRDYVEGEFTVSFSVVEPKHAGALTLSHHVTLTEPNVQAMLVSGTASAGCFVRCNDTYFSELISLSYPEGMHDFVPGSLVGRVTLLPIIWANHALPNFDFDVIHPEFAEPIHIAQGAVLAVGPERVMSVGQAKFSAIESIFELIPSPQIPEGVITVDPDRERIGIIVNPASFETIEILRGQTRGAAIVMNSVYLPAVMETLDLLRSAPEQYNSRRWYHAFVAKCDYKGVSLTPDSSILEGAQKLLETPSKSLHFLVQEDE